MSAGRERWKGSTRRSSSCRRPPECRRAGRCSGCASSIRAASTTSITSTWTAARSRRVRPKRQSRAQSAPMSPAKGARIGLIDGGVQRNHPVFRDVSIHEHGCVGGGVPNAHGTAVASLLVGHAEHFNGVAVGAELYSADVYCGLATGGAVDAVADAFAWLARERVPVINISLVGPANGLARTIDPARHRARPHRGGSGRATTGPVRRRCTRPRILQSSPSRRWMRVAAC